MKAVQYMYTSWRNAPNHGFSLYSMTPGISNVDCEDISKMMKYVLQPGMPRDPSNEDIENVLPRNVAFFPLSSGKYCLAQSAYVGREYRGFEESGRLGNYLLHAYVIDAEDDFVPMSFVGDSIFRYDLTTEEWRTTSPAPLPEVELPPVGRMLTQSEVSSFFTPERLEILSKLVQAIISSKDGKTVFFNDENRNMPYWYKALAVCLPLKHSGRTPFNTYSLSQATPMGVSPCCKLTVVNVSASKDSALPISGPSLNEETRKGNFVIDLVRKSMSPVNVGAYAKIITEKFRANLFDALTFAKKIDALVARYGCSIDRAVDINNFAEGRLDSFASLGDILAIIKEIGSGDSQMQNSIVLVADRILSGAYPFNRELCAAIKATVYPTVSQDVKKRLIGYVLNGALSSVSASNGADYARAINELLPCNSATVAEYIFESRISDSILNSNDELKIHYLVSLAVENYDSLKSVFGQAVVNTVNSVVLKYLQAENLGVIDSLLSASPRTVADSLGLAIKTVSLQNGIGRLRTETVFYALKKGTLAQADVLSVMTFAIKQWGTSSEFYAKYESFVKEVSGLDSALRAKPECAAFFDELEVYHFTKERTTLDSLYRYYEKIYVNRKEDTAFASKLREYMSGLEWKACIRDSLEVYVKCFKDKAALTDSDIKVVKQLYANVVIAPPRSEYIKALLADKSMRAAVEGFIGSVERNGFSPEANYRAINVYVTALSAAPSDIVEKIKSSEILSALSENKELISIFNKTMFEDYVCAVLGVLKETREDHSLVIRAILPLAYDAEGFKKALSDMLGAGEKEKKKTVDILNACILLYIVSAKDKDKVVSDAFEEYLGTCGKKDRIEIYRNSTKLTSDKELMRKALGFIDDFNSQHKEGFFGKLKGFFGKK